MAMSQYKCFVEKFQSYFTVSPDIFLPATNKNSNRFHITVEKISADFWFCGTLVVDAWDKCPTQSLSILAILPKPIKVHRGIVGFAHWLAGETSTSLAQKCHLARRLVDGIIKHGNTATLKELCHTEQPPIYNVWNYGNCDPRFGQRHPGRIPGQAVVVDQKTVSNALSKNAQMHEIPQSSKK